MLQGQRDLLTVGRMLLSELAPLVNAQQGVDLSDGRATDDPLQLKLLASYAHRQSDECRNCSQLGEGLVGQCALEKRRILLTGCAAGLRAISSGLVRDQPQSIVVLPVLFEGQTKAVIELASLQPFTATHLAFLEQLTESIGIVLNTIEATMRTEGLLKQSQQLAGELQTRQTELQQTNEELARKGPPTGGTKRRSGTQEPGNRTGPPGVGRKGRGTGADLQVQIGVPGEHVARVAHAAEQHSDPGPAAQRESRRAI